MGISVGSVTVDIVPDTRNFRRDLNAKLQDLTANVRAELDDKKFKTELDEATRDRTVDVKVDDHGSIAKTQKNSHLLLTTLVGLAPAVAPLGAAAIGVGAALGGLGTAGLLAFKGIQNEMKAGTPAGLVYTGMVKSLQGDLTVLEKTAADGVISGFSEAVQVADDAVPQLRAEISLLSKSLGSDLAPLLSGVVGLLHDLDPSINNVTGGIHSLALDFESWAQGPGGVRFAQYLATTLPQVEKVLSSLASAGAHLVQALLPLGGPVLGAIKGISDVISHIPVGIIQDLFVAFAGYKVITLAAAATDAFNTRLKALGLTASATAVKMDALAASEAAAAAGGGTSKGIIGRIGGSKLPVAGGLSFAGAAATGLLLGAGADNALTKHGQSLDNKAANSIAQGGPSAFAAAQKQLAGYNAELANLTAQYAAASKAGGVQFQEASGLTPKIEQLQTKTHNLAVAISLANPLVKQAAENNKTLGLNALGTADAVTHETVALSAQIAVVDKLAAANQGLYGATTNVAQSISDANKAIKENGRTLDLSTQKGRDNRTALLNVASALRAKIDAEAADGAKAPKIKADTDTAIGQLETLAHKLGLSTTNAHNLAAALLGLPKNVKVNLVDAGYGPVRADLANLISLERQASGRGQTKNATGGLLRGPGTGTSDSIVARVSNGEFVVNANATSRNLALLHKINSSTPAFASGGLVGGASDVNISAIQALLNAPTTSASTVSASRLSEARATASLAAAESALDKLRREKHVTSSQIDAAEKRITADRIALANATTRLRSAESSYAAGRKPLLTKYISDAASTARTDSTFLSNLNKLSARGFGLFAQTLLAEGDSDAMTIAAQAVKLGNTQLSSLQRSLQSDANTQAALANFGQPAAGGTGSQSLPPIYVQNPFTGEYLLAQTDSRTASLLRQQARAASAGRR